MELKEKLTILIEVYHIYEGFLKSYAFACKRYCSDCCTCNVTMTTLEAFYLVDNMILENRIDLFSKLDKIPEKRFQPKYTFNRMAAFYSQGKDIEEEPCDPSWGRCPFLSGNECLFYHFRPFGCRCLVSATCCTETGFAVMDPLVITVNNLFMQFIEHVDIDGYSGNFVDVLKWMENKENRELYEQGCLRELPQDLVGNTAIPLLMVPSEHRSKVGYLLSAFNSLLLKSG